MRRKDFIRLGALLAGSALPLKQYARHPQQEKPARVDFINDGLVLSPKEYASLLMKMADEGTIKPDYYSNGGIVEELESRFARLLGKEASVFMPTGTLANHIAVRKLAGNSRRVIVQEQSHLYQDSGDCSETLSGLNLIPLGLNEVGFTIEEIERIERRTKTGRVETSIGVIMIETPVRRQLDRMVLFDEIKRIYNHAQANSIRMHIDGARLFVQAVHENKSPAEYGRLCDTVFTSLWKCFNAPSGAVLAGSRECCQKLFHERRMFGGGLPAAWPLAAIALHYADGFADEYKKAWQEAQQLFTLLKNNERFLIREWKEGSHIVEFNIQGASLVKFKAALEKRGVDLLNPDEKGLLLKINPSLNRSSADKIATLFTQALKEA